MLYFLSELSDGGDAFNLFRYITFRSGGALERCKKMGNLSVRTGLLVILFKKQELQQWVEF